MHPLPALGLVVAVLPPWLPCVPAQDDTLADESAWLERFAFGGYGEMHANFVEGSGDDQFDIHRLVFYVGYAFDDWIRLESETELEHAFVEEGNGELSIEQLHLDFLLSDDLNLRAGRFLAPLGIVNQRHEPPTFNGVERPSVETFLIPSTWSLDGAGIFGRLCESATYELYLSAGLDGSQFSGSKGIRDGRLKERPGLSDPALSGRVDWRPFEEADVRLGLSGFAGGANNGNKGLDPGVDSEVLIAALDVEASVGRWDFRGVLAEEEIDGAEELNDAFGNDVAEGLGGYYVEAACHVLPDAWRDGRLERYDLVLFARWEDFDTQRDRPSNAAPSAVAQRRELTAGASFFLTEKLVLKADVQLLADDSADRPDGFNLGLGWWY
jgi:hypothetical protein